MNVLFNSNSSQLCLFLLQMFFRDLPDELNPGRIPLTPVGSAARHLTACDACGEFSLKRILGSCGHVFCVSCCIVRDAADGLQLRCFFCRKNVVCERTDLKEAFLKDIEFACGCGHEGNLAQIREHLWSHEVDHGVYDGNVEQQQQQVKDSTQAEHTPPHAETPNDKRGPRSPAEDQTVAAGVEVVKEKKKDHLIKILRAELKPLRMVARVSPKTRAYFCFELHKLMDDFVYKRFTLENSTLTWVGSEYATQVYCKITVVSDKRYLGVFIKPVSEPPSASAWPMKKKIIVELYNSRGESVQKKVAATFSNGEPSWDGFVRPYHPKELGGHGFEKFYAIDDLLATDALIVVNGKVCLSVELQDLMV